MFRNSNSKMLVFITLMLLTLLMVAFLTINISDGYAASQIGEVVGVCDASCTTSG